MFRQGAKEREFQFYNISSLRLCEKNKNTLRTLRKTLRTLQLKIHDMITIKYFTFNDFQENTYILHDETLEAIVIDPGCSNAREEKILLSYIADNNLKVVRLLNTHCHIDHVFGNYLIHEKFDVKLEVHQNEIEMLKFIKPACAMWHITEPLQPEANTTLVHGETIIFGNNNVLEIIFTPGHSPGSVCFYSAKENFIVSGDVLFKGSIGRTDLPKGNHKDLLKSIRENLFTLPDDTKVFSGHGEPTLIGYERHNNPFFR